MADSHPEGFSRLAEPLGRDNHGSTGPARMAARPAQPTGRPLRDRSAQAFAEAAKASRLLHPAGFESQVAAIPERVSRRQPRSGSVRTKTESLVFDDETKVRRFRELALPHLDDAYNFARWLTHGSQEAEDVVQDAYMRAFQYFDGFKGVNPRAWILTIVRNSYLAGLRKARAQSTVPFDDERNGDGREGSHGAREPFDPDQGDAESALIKKSDAAALRRMIAALPSAYRETLVLREMEEFTYQQISEITGVPLGTVMSRLARARGLLQKAWMQHQEKERGA